MDGDTTKVDTLPEKGLSSQGKVSPSDVFTKEQVDELVRQRHSTLDKKIAEYEKRLADGERVKMQLEELKTQAKEREQKEWEDRLKAAEGDPDAMATVKRELRLRDKERELALKEVEIQEKNAQHEEYLAAANEAGRQKLASELATEFSIDVETLLSFSPDTPEKMRETAERLSKIASKGGLKTDSGVGIGAGVNWRELNPNEKIRAGLSKNK